MKITTELVEHVSALARLELPEGEKAAMAVQLEQIVGYMDVLARLDTNEVEPMSHVFPLKNVMRPDTVEPSMDREALLANAPAPDREAFLVPKTVE